MGDMAIGGSGPATKEIKETSTYGKITHNVVIKAILDGKRENIRTYAGESGEYDMPAYDRLQLREEALVMLKKLFFSLGYKVGHVNEPYINTDVVLAFQKLCGINEGNGQLIGKKTIVALITASEAKKDWKKAVAGMYDNKQMPSSKNISEIRQKLEHLQFVRDGFNLTYMDPKMQVILEQAYSSLGFVVSGDNLRVANYKLQIISGVNEDVSLSKVYGPATNKALVKALIAIEHNRNWRKEF